MWGTGGPSAQLLPEGKPYFVDVSRDYGLTELMVKDADIVWVVGGGACWGDYDRDGDLDLYVVGWRAPGRLYRNDGTTFRDVTEEHGLLTDKTRNMLGMSCTWVDYDNSGLPSLFLTLYESPYGNVLFKNVDGKYFRDVTELAGLVGKPGKIAAGAAWSDVNRDGCLDLYVGYYVNLRSVQSGQIFGRGAGNLLYINNCNGTFREESKRYGVEDFGYTFQPLFLDYDDDGYQDLFLANDFGLTRLYRNIEGAKFEIVSQHNGVERAGQWMGVAAGDLDLDGLWEIIVTNYDDNLLLKNAGGYFVDIASRVRLSDPYQVGWGVCILDVDNDGKQDVFIANGKIGVRSDRPTKQYSRLFYNLGPFFLDATWSAGLANHGNARGLACADYDQDGGVDILVYELTRPPILYKNQVASKSAGTWVQVRLEGSTWLCALCAYKSTREAVGAVVEIEVHGRIYRQQVVKGSSYLSDNGPWLYFGLGNAGRIDRLTVFWPSGIVEEYRDLPVNSVIRVVESGGCFVQSVSGVVHGK
jgi:ASPIC and UnbV.